MIHHISFSITPYLIIFTNQLQLSCGCYQTVAVHGTSLDPRLAVAACLLSSWLVWVWVLHHLGRGVTSVTSIVSVPGLLHFGPDLLDKLSDLSLQRLVPSWPSSPPPWRSRGFVVLIVSLCVL